VILDTARVGLDDFIHAATPARRLAGLRNAVVWGRAVTNVLQNIKTFDRERFARWYEPRQAVLRENADFKYLYELRSQLLKEGVLGRISGSMHIEHFNTNQLAELHPPPGARGFFLGDRLGGSGWEVALGDGTVETYYIELPTTWKIKTAAHFADVTTELGLPPPAKPIDRLLAEYLDHLSGLIRDADAEFKPRPV
jgi:hypothetical protein